MEKDKLQEYYDQLDNTLKWWAISLLIVIVGFIVFAMYLVW